MAERHKMTKEEREEKKKNMPIRESIEEVQSITEITMPLIKKYIIAQGESDIEWLIEILERKVTVKDKEGKEKTRRCSFIEIRNEFARKYRPDIAPKGTTRKTSVIDDTVAELQAALAAKRGQQ